MALVAWPLWLRLGVGHGSFLADSRPEVLSAWGGGIWRLPWQEEGSGALSVTRPCLKRLWRLAAAGRVGCGRDAEGDSRAKSLASAVTGV
jgi:hypothetical protein